MKNKKYWNAIDLQYDLSLININKTNCGDKKGQYKSYLLFLLFTFYFINTYGQTVKKNSLNPYKVGFLYNYGANENFISDDKDYSYNTNTFKTQFFYKLKKFKKFELELIIQPQVQLIKHQLINKQFITPEQDNYLEKRIEFTKEKKMKLYSLEFGVSAKKRILKKLDLKSTLSLGFSIIDTRTERLAKGFTFIENFSFGFSYNTYKNSFLYIGSNWGHVSNLDFQRPNSGYNILGLEIGYSFILI